MSQMCLVEDTLHIGNLQFHRACRIMPESNKWKDGGDLQLCNMEGPTGSCISLESET